MDMSRLLSYTTIPSTAVKVVNTSTAWVFVCICVYTGVCIDIRRGVSTKQCVDI